MFFLKIKETINKLEQQIKELNQKLELLKKEQTSKESFACNCIDNTFERIMISSNDGYWCKTETRFEDKVSEGRCNHKLELYVCNKCGAVKGKLVEPKKSDSL